MSGSAVATLGLRLIGLARMCFAVGRTQPGLAAAEMKLVLGGVADRPAAHAIIDRQNGRKAAVLENHWIFLDDGGLRHRDARHRSMRDRVAWALRTGWSSAPRKAQAMDLANDGVA